MKCEAIAGGYAKQICDELQSVIQKNYGKGGVKAVTSTTRAAITGNDYENARPLGECVTIHKPGKRLLMRFCPFCGGSLFGANPTPSSN